MKAIILGATGLVGNLILQDVLSDVDFSEIRIFVRKPTGIKSPKLIEIISDLKDVTSLSSGIFGDVLFNALGTTIKLAGTQAEQQRIDRDLPIAFAKMATENGVKIMLNVSSVGANLEGGFYLKTKAEMEKGTEQYFHEKTFHFRPSLLLGKRKDFRLAERVAFGFMKVLDPLLIGSAKKYRSMPADKLAKAMVKVSKNSNEKPNILHYSEIMQCLE